MSEQIEAQVPITPQTFLDIAGVMFLALDKKGNITLINQKGCDILESTQKKIVGKNWFDHFIPKGIVRNVKSVFRQIMDGEIEPVEYYENPVLTVNGQEKIVAWHNTILKDRSGNIVGTLSSGEDITERKRAEDEVHRMAKFPSLNPNPVLSITTNGDVQFKNRAGSSLLKIWKYRKNQPLSGEPLQRVRKVNRTNKQEQTEIDFNHKTYLLTFSPVKNSNIINIYGMDITERKKAEDRIIHLNTILMAIRNVNQLITQEKDPEKLIQGTCENLVQARGYQSAWIGLLDNSGDFSVCAEAGFGNTFGSMVNQLKKVNLPFCGRKALKQSHVVVFNKTSVSCPDCPISQVFPENKRMTMKLKYGQKIYGFLNVSVPSKITIDNEEKRLFQEIANDIAFALHDIDIETERKRVKEALQRSEEQFRQFFENDPEYCYMISTECVILDINQTALHTLGYKKEELIGKPLHTIYAPNYVRKMEQLHKRWIRTGQLKDEEMVIITKAGERRYVLLSAGAIKDTDGKILHSISVQKDITERKQAEEALKESEETFSTMFEKMQAAVSLVNLPSGEIHSVNQACLDLIGYSRKEEVIGKTSVESGLVRDLESHQIHLDELNKMGRMKNVEVEIYDKSDKLHILLVNAEGVKIKGQKYILTSLLDITERKKAEEALRENEETIRAFVETSQDWIWSIDLDGIHTYSNPAVAKILGYQSEDLVGKSSLKLLHKKDRQTIETQLPQWIKRKRGWKNLVLRWRHKDGSWRWLESSAVPIFNVDKKLIGFRGVDRDVTERKQLEELIQVRMRLMEFATTHSLKELLQRTLDEVCKFTGSSVGFYHFVEADQKTLSLQAWSTRTVKEFCHIDGQGMHYNINEAGVWVDCIRERRPIIHNDYASLPHRKGMPEGHVTIVRELVMPIMRKDRFMAILGVGNKPQDYNDQDIEVVSYIADVAWVIAEHKQAEEALRKSEENFRLMVSEVKDYSIIMLDPEGFIVSWNEGAQAINGYCAEEIIGKHFSCLFTNEDIQADKPNKILRIASRQGRFEEEAWRVRKDGTRFIANFVITVIRDEKGKLIGFSKVTRDITDRKKTENMLRESEKRFRYFIEQAPAAIMVHDLEGRILLLNNLTCKHTGYSMEELLTMNVSELDHEVITKGHRKRYWEKLKMYEYTRFEGIHERKDHTTYPAEIHIVKIKFNEQPMILGFFSDISERKQIEEQIQKDLKEKEILLREIHHRVKNNLQIIKSLLNLQSYQVKNKTIVKAFNECVSRIQSMAMVHEQLYYSNDFTNIPFKTYIERISKELLNSYRLDTVISLNIRVKHIFLSIDKAIPLGLILNELLTNALKYAFKGMEKGRITISFQLKEDQLYELIFRDNGVGMSADVDFTKTESLGLYLIKILTEQIDGMIVVKRQNGTSFKIVFPKT